MDEQEIKPQDAEAAPLNRTRLIGGALDVAGGLLVLAAVVWAVLRFWELSEAQLGWAQAGASIAGTVVLMLVGLGVAALFFAIGEGVRKLEDFSEYIRGESSEPAARQGPLLRREPAPNAEAMGELVGLMREVRDISLLSEAERSARLRAQADELSRRLEREVPELLREHKWYDAFKRVRTARDRFPTVPVWDELERQILAVRSRVESHDIEAATRQIEELVSLNAWDRASDVMRDLLERHPKAQGAQELGRRLRLQREKAEAEMRAKLMTQAQEYSNRRDWGNALTTARTIVERFPNSPEAEALRSQLRILEANAEVRERQRMEAGIRDLLARQRYEEAVRQARALIARYPHSPQAAVLHDQLPRLEEKAAGR
jgi:outer membrane protein assembly factor BamD (BamD/ComL family)